MVAPIQVSIYYDRGSSTAEETAKNIEKLFRKLFPALTFNKFRHTDPRESYFHADLNIHMGWPVLAAVPWALANIAVRYEGESAWCEVWGQALNYGKFDEVITATDLLDEGSEAVQMAAKSACDKVLARRPKHGVVHCPPFIVSEDCPPISIVTPSYMRKDMIDIAFHNLLSTDYPHDKIEWVVVEDSDKSENMMSDRIINFQANAPTIRVKYIPIQGRMSIGEKRNIGVEHTTNDIVLFMDDDDHYPPTSFRRRVSWLLKGRRGDTIGADVAVCTSIAMYDLQRGVSAVNVPPWNIPLAQRISEATLTFRKSFWEERKFTDTSMAEGEGWITGRESAVLEMTPQHIIVAFTHGANMSSRRVAPVDAKVGCFWGFPKEYLLFIHKLVGVDIVEDTK